MDTIELSFSIAGAHLPLDHGYLLYSAIKLCLESEGGVDTLNALVSDRSLGIYSIGAVQASPDRLNVTRCSRVVFRLRPEQVRVVIPVSGKTLQVGPSRLRLGIPTVHRLSPATSLRSRIVTIKGFTDPIDFLEAARRQLAALPLGSSPTLTIPCHENGQRKGEFIRRVLRIRGRTVVGFPMEVQNITAPDSILLQSVGLGGRRHMGCGVFIRWRSEL